MPSPATDVSAPTKSAKKIILMNRTDGLGERLCAMINAIRLADCLDADLRFHWTSDVWNPVYHQLDVEASTPVLGHSIGSAADFFSKDYIGRHGLDNYERKMFRAFPAKPISLEQVLKIQTEGNISGWTPSQHFLESEFDSGFMSRVKLDTASAFHRIEFSASISSAIRAARSMDVGPYIALHMRSGDMVFGEVRKWGLWSNKVLNPSVAKDIITDAKRKGKRVAIFGQDVETLGMLRDKFGAMLPYEVANGLGLNSVERAMFEIIFMSRADMIIGGNSGFARAACMIGGKQLTNMFSLYSAIDYSNITLKDLLSTTGEYHRLVTAYSYWQAYAFGRAKRTPQELAKIISKAAEYDPGNLLYRIIHAALQYRMHADVNGERELAALMDKHPADAPYDANPAVQQLVFKYYSSEHSHKEQFADFLDAGKRPGNKYAKIFASAIERLSKP